MKPSWYVEAREVRNAIAEGADDRRLDQLRRDEERSFLLDFAEAERECIRWRAMLEDLPPGSARDAVQAELARAEEGFAMFQTTARLRAMAKARAT